MSVEDHQAQAQKLAKKSRRWHGIFGGGKRRRLMAEAQLHTTLAGQKQAERERPSGSDVGDAPA